MKHPTLTPQAKAGHLSRSRGMVPACWLGTDALRPHLYTSPTCLFTQNPFTPPALASQPQGPKPLTHWFLPFWPEQVAIPQGLQACQLLTSLPSWPLLVCLCVWPANREATRKIYLSNRLHALFYVCILILFGLNIMMFRKCWWLAIMTIRIKQKLSSNALIYLEYLGLSQYWKKKKQHNFVWANKQLDSKLRG